MRQLFALALRTSGFTISVTLSRPEQRRNDREATEGLHNFRHNELNAMKQQIYNLLRRLVGVWRLNSRPPAPKVGAAKVRKARSVNPFVE